MSFLPHIVRNENVCLFLIIYLSTHSMDQSPSCESKRFSASQEIPHILWNRMSITAFTNTRQLSLPWASSIQSTPPHLTSGRSILILLSHLRLSLQSVVFLSGFPTKIVYKPFPIHAIFPAPLIGNDLIIRIIIAERYRPLSSSLCSFLQYPVTSSP